MGVIEQLAEIKAGEALEKGMKKGMKKGRQEGRREEREKNVKHLLASTEFSVSKVAELLGVPVSFVEEVKESLQPQLLSK